MSEPYLPVPTDGLDVAKAVGIDFPANAPMAVVVMSTNSDFRALRAARSVLEQDIKAQVVVVNTGEGTLRQVLTPILNDIMLIETPQRQFPGGTRNLGIKHSSAPIVGFLAADCVAESSWLQKRCHYHSTHPAVSSSIEPLPSASDRLRFIARCAHLAVHRHRLANSSRKYRIHYGLSYARSIFSIYGLFDETVRIGEDTLLNAQLETKNQVFHAQDVVTFHEYPSSIYSAISDQIRRGRRRARFAITHNSSRTRLLYSEIRKIVNWYVLDIFRDPALRSMGSHVVACSALLSVASAFACLFPSDADP